MMEPSCPTGSLLTPSVAYRLSRLPTIEGVKTQSLDACYVAGLASREQQIPGARYATQSAILISVSGWSSAVKALPWLFTALLFERATAAPTMDTA